MTDIGELKVTIKADAAQLERKMAEANGIVKQSAGGMTTAFSRLKSEILSLAPAISAVGLVAFGKNAIDVAGHIVDLSDRIGFAAGTLSALEIPLAASGASLDEFTGAINRMNNILGEAAKGNEEAIKAFDSLGLSVDKLRKLSPEEQFYEIATALGQIKDQSTQTEAGMNIFGRTFAVLLPLLKEYEGDMRKAVAAQKNLNERFEESLKRVDEFGDAMSAAAIKTRNYFVEALAAILKVSDAINEVLEKPSVNAKWNMPGQNPLPQSYIDKAKSMGMVTEATFAGQAHTEFPLEEAGKKGASGSNAALFARIQAQKDAAKATKEHTNSAKEEADAIRLCTTAYDELAESTQEAARFQQILHDKLSASLTDIVFKARSAEDAMLAFAESIARAAFEKSVAGPIADALIGSSGGTGLLDGLLGQAGGLLGFADGGRPPMGMPSIVGERGPEIFVPDQAGTVIPNHMMGGSTVNVSHTWNIASGVTRQEVASLIPVIEARTKASVFAEIEKGGKAARAVGRR